MWKEDKKGLPHMMPIFESDYKKPGLVSRSKILMDGERVEGQVIVDYLNHQIPCLCQALAEYRYKDAEIALSIAGTTKAYFSLLDNIKAPLLMLIVCEDIYYNFHSLDVYDDQWRSACSAAAASFTSSSTSSSCASAPARLKRYNLSSIYLQIMDDLGKVRDCFTADGPATDLHEDSVVKEGKMKGLFPYTASSMSSNFSFISLNTSRSGSVFSDVAVSTPGVEHEESRDSYFVIASNDNDDNDNNSFVSSASSSEVDAQDLDLEHDLDHDHGYDEEKESDVSDADRIILLHMLDEVVIFIGMRIAMINVYKSLRLCDSAPSLLGNVPNTLEENLSTLSKIEVEVRHSFEAGFTSPGVQSLIQQHVLRETQCLQSIITARVAILSGKYIESILACQDMDVHIKSWKSLQLQVVGAAGPGSTFLQPASSLVNTAVNNDSVPMCSSSSAPLSGHSVQLDCPRERRPSTTTCQETCTVTCSSTVDERNISTALHWATLCQKRLLTLIYFIFQERRKKTITLIGGYGVSEKSVLSHGMFVLPSSMLVPRSGDGSVAEQTEDHFPKTPQLVSTGMSFYATSCGSDSSSTTGFRSKEDKLAQFHRTRSASNNGVSDPEIMGIKIPPVAVSMDFNSTSTLPRALTSAGAAHITLDLDLDKIINTDEEIRHVIDSFYRATQPVFSRSILIIVSIADSPVISTTEDGQEWVIKQKLSFTCPPSTLWNTSLSIREQLESSVSSFSDQQQQQPQQPQQPRQPRGGSVAPHTKTGLVLLSKLLPSQKFRTAQKIAARFPKNSVSEENVVASAPSFTRLTSSSHGAVRSESFAHMAASISFVAGGGIAGSTPPRAPSTGGDRHFPAVSSVASGTFLDGGKRKESMFGDSSSTGSRRRSVSVRTAPAAAAAAATAGSVDVDVDDDYFPDMDEGGSGSDWDEESGEDSDCGENEAAEGRPEGSSRGKNWIQSHLKGIGEMISSAFPVQRNGQRRHSASSNSANPYDFNPMSSPPPRTSSPPQPAKSPIFSRATGRTDGNTEGGSVASNANASSIGAVAGASAGIGAGGGIGVYGGAGGGTGDFPTKETIRTSCGLDRSAGYHTVTGELNASTGAYFFAPLNDMTREDSDNYIHKFLRRKNDAQENRSRLFLVGATFDQLRPDHGGPVMSTAFKDTMIEHILSIGTFLRADDLFVDVGNTKRHA